MLGGPPGGLSVVATISVNETAAAVLAAAVVVAAGGTGAGAGSTTLAGPGAVAVIGSTISWGVLAKAERYALDGYYSFVYGVLRHFDMPDLAAATGQLPVLVRHCLPLTFHCLRIAVP